MRKLLVGFVNLLNERKSYLQYDFRSLFMGKEEELMDAAIIELAKPQRVWLIWDFERGMWWKNGGNGYTKNVDQAGRYTAEECEKWLHSGNFNRDGMKDDAERDKPNTAIVRDYVKQKREPCCELCSGQHFTDQCLSI